MSRKRVSYLWLYPGACLAAVFVAWACFEKFFLEGGAPGPYGTANAFMFPAVTATAAAVPAALDELRRGRVFRALAYAASAFSITLAVGYFLQALGSILFNSYVPAEAVFSSRPESQAFLLLQFGRSLGWGVPSIAVGIGVGLAGRDAVSAATGSMGALLGGLIGGFLFDPIQLIVFGSTPHSAWLGRMVGFAVIGGMVGLVTGVQKEVRSG